MTDDDDTTGGNGSASFAVQFRSYERRGFKVAPTDGSSRFNAIRIPLIPVACWKLEDPGFAFDSSFVAPGFHYELTTLAGIVTANPDCPAALFAHCDPAGSDAVNKILSDRRAIAVYALLTRKPDLWAHLYDNPQVGDVWGTHAIQAMLATVKGRTTDDDDDPCPDPASTPYYSGTMDGRFGPGTTGAVKAFQSACGQNNPTGQADAATRKALFGAYMDSLCTPDPDPAATPADPSQPSPSTVPFRMQAADFLGGPEASPDDLPKMSLQGCSKFNPIVLLTSAEMRGSDTTSRNAGDAPNRRVIMYLFPKGTKVDPAVWPCPKVKEPGDACKRAFWRDGDQRRKNGDTLCLYDETRDTIACRFYDRFARRSPCEGRRPTETFAFGTYIGEGGCPTDSTVYIQGENEAQPRTYLLSEGKMTAQYSTIEIPNIHPTERYSIWIQNTSFTYYVITKQILSTQT